MANILVYVYSVLKSILQHLMCIDLCLCQNLELASGGGGGGGVEVGVGEGCAISQSCQNKGF